ncbi:MAG: FMN-binding glutamate synthase family protein [Firmicutes bacterium]|uniref:FMN-binding glutamate synthase family protein n=1 Tax=Melghirimyces thermohalophilus TaxID=1236220 RepID=UPI0015A44620|nr:FMN-binding glutamate synthase family protein [Melghirimyces thermohalophilus]MDA8354570.1 FMN-binding glutamate synthase family protein [Bacillota bacterium]
MTPVHVLENLFIALIGVVVVAVIAVVVIVFWLYFQDINQKKHSVLRNFPVLGKMRYILEKIGPELRQYLFYNDNEGKPFSRRQYEDVVIAAKYKHRLFGFGTERNYEEEGYFIRNSLFPKQEQEMRVDNERKIPTKVYSIDDESLFRRKEHRESAEVNPFYLLDEDAVVLGQDTCRHPFRIKGLVGQSAMSYGALGNRAITALSTGLRLAGGTWMNTGEGGLSEYHLKGGADVIMQIGPGLFGVRTIDGEFSWKAFKEKSEIEQVKAFELKLAQGAKTRGGHLDGAKVTPEIAEIRGVEPYQSIDSPNRFKEFGDPRTMIDFIERLREVGGKPIGVKLVVGDTDGLDQLAATMAATGKGPDFITIDGGEGGTGASYQELADSVGYPIYSALPIADDLLRKYQVRDRVKLIASGKLVTPDRIAVALAMGADLVNIARGFMMSVGCIQALVCHTNRCPVGVATTDASLQKALVVEEKSYRVCNYLISLREGLYNIAAAAGIDTPTQFERKHIVFKDRYGRMHEMEHLFSGEVR